MNNDIRVLFILDVHDDLMHGDMLRGLKNIAFVRALGICHASVKSTGVFGMGGCILL